MTHSHVIPGFSGWLKRRRTRAAERERWYALRREHQARVNAVIAAADFRSWKSFYEDSDRRRANEVAIGEILDGEFRCHIIWFPTTEVVAWPFRWRDEQWHSRVLDFTTLRTPKPSTKSLGPAELPQIIYVVGRAENAEQGRLRLASASNLAEVRAALA